MNVHFLRKMLSDLLHNTNNQTFDKNKLFFDVFLFLIVHHNFL